MNSQHKILNISSSTRWQTIATVSTGSRVSSAISATSVIIASISAPHYVAFAVTATNSTTNFVMPANSILEFSISPGQQIAVKCSDTSPGVTGIISILK